MTTHADTPETGSDGGPTSGRAHRTGPRMSIRMRQMSYDHVCALLRGALLDGAQASPGAADGIGSVQVRASATLYGLLMDHPLTGKAAAGPTDTPVHSSGVAIAGCTSTRATGCTIQISSSCRPSWPTNSDGLPPARQRPNRTTPTCCPRSRLTRSLSRHRPRLLRPSFLTGPLGRGGRTQITAGPGMFPWWPPVSPWPIPGPTTTPPRVGRCCSPGV
jgi:hypothetical protein